MSVTDDALKAKFSTLNETQDSIVSVSNWMMFHRRHADRVVQAWHARLRDVAAPKRLNLLYLANEVVQQSRLRRREEFPNAFSPIVADAVQLAYKGAVSEVQQKIRRLVEVWRQRNVFEVPIMDAIEARLEEIDKTRASGKKALMGSSLFSSSKGSLPKELEPLGLLQEAVSKASITSMAAKNTANTEYDKLNDAAAALPTPPVHAARLSSLMKALANAETSVNESIKTRKELIAGLEKILESNKAELTKEEAQQQELSSKRESTEAKKRDVEDRIMKGMVAAQTSTGSPDATDADHPATATNGSSEEIERPEYEALTPPPVEALTPPIAPADSSSAPVLPDTGAIPEDLDVTNLLANISGNPPASTTPPIPAPYQTFSTTTNTLVRPRSSDSGMNGTATTTGSGPGIKKRKMSHEDEEFAAFAKGDAMDDLDEDVAELLRQESGGGKA